LARGAGTLRWSQIPTSWQLCGRPAIHQGVACAQAASVFAAATSNVHTPLPDTSLRAPTIFILAAGHGPMLQGAV